MDNSEAVRNVFRAVWKEITTTLPEDSLDKDEVWMWWPTLKTLEPNWEALHDNLVSFAVNPYVRMLTIYCYGYSKALDDVMNERIFPVSQAGERRLPEWLEQTILEDLKKRYGEKH